MKSEADMMEFDFLKKILALELDALAKVIPVNEMIVEKRVVLKCKVGCKQYGKH